MGREVRMVPPDWQHPKDARGRYIPLHDGPSLAEHMEYADDDAGPPPNPADYMPRWMPDQATHLMMYETCSEGTPISPAFATPEELARWLADNRASAFGGMTATYEQWLAMAKRGWAPSAVVQGGVMRSGVADVARKD